MWIFPNVKGILDSSLIRLHRRPGGLEDPHAYWCRKGFPAVHLQAVVDHKKRFIDTCIGHPGRMHDSSVFRESNLFNNHNQIFGEDKYLLADKGYPLTNWVMTPYKKINNIEEQNFNQKLSRARVLVEHALYIEDEVENFA